MPISKDQIAVLLVSLLGLILHLYTLAFRVEGPVSPFLVGLFLWSLLPYTATAFASFRPSLFWPALGFAIGSLSGDIFMHYSVFITPKGSTAGLGLLFMPLWNLILLGPLGALSFWAAYRVYRSRNAGAP